MSTLGERIRAARKNAGLTQKRLADRIGMRAANTISNWEQNINRPDIDQLALLSRVLGISLDYLLNCYEGTQGLRLAPEEQHLVEQFRLADEDGQKLIQTVAEFEAARFQKRQDEQKRKDGREYDAPASRFINNYGNVAAGHGAWFTGEPPESVAIRLDPVSQRADYAVEVTGDSMEPDFHDGDLLLVQQTSVVDQGELGVFAYDGQGYFKKLGDGELISLNPKYDPIVPEGDVAIQGRVIGKAERLE